MVDTSFEIAATNSAAEIDIRKYKCPACGHEQIGFESGMIARFGDKKRAHCVRCYVAHIKVHIPEMKEVK